MNINGLVLLFGSCATSFFLAVWVFMAGYGLIAAFLVYAIGGAMILLGMAALVYLGPTMLKPAFAPRKKSVKARLVAVRA